MAGLLTSPRFHSSMTILLITIILLSLLFFWKSDVSLLFLIFLCGATGGFVATYLRLRRIPPNAMNDRATSFIAVFQVYITPLTSGIFAIVLYALALTGLIAGALFPNFKNLDKDYLDVVSLFTTISPVSQLDAAKALVWGFIAGFSEKLIPNILDKLGSETISKK